MGGVLMRESPPCSAWCGCEREKVRHAWLVGGDSGRKFAMHAKNALNWAISCERGEFYTGSGPVRFLLGEFCLAMAPLLFPVGPERPPIGLTCAVCVHRSGACRARRPPGAFHISRDTTEAGPRRVPPLVARGGRAVGAEKSAPETQRPSLSSAITAAVESGVNAQFFHQPLTVSTAWVPRSDSAEWALTRPEDRRAAWKREATFSQFTRFHQALT